MSKLTVGKIKALAQPGLYNDSPTLYLAVSRTGSKSWIQRVVIDGRRHDIGLGGWPLITLVEAREQANKNRKRIRKGRDPLAEKRKKRKARKAKEKRKAKRASVPTFREAADRMFDAKRPSLRTEKSARLWIATLERYAHPVLGDMPVDKIGREDVLRVLTPIWTSKPPSARKLRQRIKATLAWAQAHGHVEHNIAGEAIDGALPTMPAVKSNLRALPYGEVAAALDSIEASGASLSARLCFRFLVLTASRSGEARGATWAEIDLDARQWRIPGSRMKAGNEHRVPLCDAAIEVLEQAQSLPEGSGLIFPSPTKRAAPLSDMSLTKVLRTTGLAERATVHGFRSSFRDWCAETGKPREIAEAALAHTVKGVEGAYFRSDLFERRRLLMDQWAEFATGKSAKVVELPARTA